MSVKLALNILKFMNTDRPLGEVQERQAIAKLDREDLEDKFFRLREQNLVSDHSLVTIIMTSILFHYNSEKAFKATFIMIGTEEICKKARG